MRRTFFPPIFFMLILFILTPIFSYSSQEPFIPREFSELYYNYKEVLAEINLENIMRNIVYF
ncbi:MAG: hypothetical protein QXG40_08315, partial [Ignisphaera sp.]